MQWSRTALEVVLNTFTELFKYLLEKPLSTQVCVWCTFVHLFLSRSSGSEHLWLRQRLISIFENKREFTWLFDFEVFVLLLNKLFICEILWKMTQPIYYTYKKLKHRRFSISCCYCRYDVYVTWHECVCVSVSHFYWKQNLTFTLICRFLLSAFSSSIHHSSSLPICLSFVLRYTDTRFVKTGWAPFNSLLVYLLFTLCQPYSPTNFQILSEKTYQNAFINLPLLCFILGAPSLYFSFSSSYYPILQLLDSFCMCYIYTQSIQIIDLDGIQNQDLFKYFDSEYTAGVQNVIS